jgi:hypothetical protein
MAKKSEENLPATGNEGSDQFAIMKMPVGEIGELLNENLAGESISISDLVTITVPSQGLTTWTVPSIDGEITTKEIVGILVYSRMTRTYWETSFDDSGGGAFPDCFSLDAIHGIGIMADKPEVGGICKKCPMDKFNTGKDGEGKACKEKRQMFMVLKDELLPVLVRVPVKSVAPSKKYLLSLISRRTPIHSIYTKLTLEQDKNKKGIKYSKIVFQKVGDVENPVASAAYAKAIKPYLEDISEQMVRNANPLEDASFDPDEFE